MIDGAFSADALLLLVVPGVAIGAGYRKGTGNPFRAVTDRSLAYGLGAVAALPTDLLLWRWFDGICASAHRGSFGSCIRDGQELPNIAAVAPLVYLAGLYAVSLFLGLVWTRLRFQLTPSVSKFATSLADRGVDWSGPTNEMGWERFFLHPEAEDSFYRVQLRGGSWVIGSLRGGLVGCSYDTERFDLYFETCYYSTPDGSIAKEDDGAPRKGQPTWISSDMIELVEPLGEGKEKS